LTLIFFIEKILFKKRLLNLFVYISRKPGFSLSRYFESKRDKPYTNPQLFFSHNKKKEIRGFSFSLTICYLLDLIVTFVVVILQGGQDLSSFMSEEDLHMVENEEQLNQCLEQLRDIVGNDVPREELVRVALAADYDVNRAVNYFFLSS
jgi:hypothetical protein